MPLISIEGIDGVGKSTLIGRLARHFPDVVITREPHEPIEDDIAGIPRFFAYVQDHANYDEALIRVLCNGNLIITDRYIDSRIAYGMEQLKNRVADPFNYIINLHEWSYWPDLTVLLIKNMDRPIMEGPLNLQFVQRNYLRIARQCKSRKFVIVDVTDLNEQEVEDIVACKIREFLLRGQIVQSPKTRTDVIFRHNIQVGIDDGRDVSPMFQA